MNAQPGRRKWRTEETRAASIDGLASGRRKSASVRTIERENGMAFAREWRERNKGRDWSLPANARCVCALCGAPA